MNDRKQHVMKVAHQLFIEKGFLSTSIQDILHYSGISKGTFYNYFPSKNELLMAIFHSVHERLEIERNKILIGQDRSDINIFIHQIELQMKLNKQNKLFSLFEEVMVSNDKDFKDFFIHFQLSQLNWVFHRLVDIYGEEKKPYLLDCTIMFTGILHHHFHYFFKQKQPGLSINKVITYSVDRLSSIVENVASKGEYLFEPELIEEWFPSFNQAQKDFRNCLEETVINLKKIIHKELPQEHLQMQWMELLNFIREEVLQSKQPRFFLVESVIDSLINCKLEPTEKELSKLKELVQKYKRKL
ncbi:TetR/AcrR family transcriptional regulator [Bacillus sp. FJAT-49736]|uniref:TetR/AcrR family transcriptional regulator n=1 Tax=Bacillus sp. FJAT-49736 TaxID=2833582 RepID=UPI001BC9487D|nr:TetR/AcrR family transcriptional regulator [Bacillus sp. FJAT-49736]MBS4174090.1 TetR/AcrR family transcriptional regulator [Bacillus sp. FJAT-49736]